MDKIIYEFKFSMRWTYFLVKFSQEQVFFNYVKTLHKVVEQMRICDP